MRCDIIKLCLIILFALCPVLCCDPDRPARSRRVGLIILILTWAAAFVASHGWKF